MVFIHKNNLITKDQLIELVDNEGAVILIDKPLDWTSFDVVAKIRNTLKIKKIGHAGTLDPLATGLLIICVGRKATKNIDLFQSLEKFYSATIKFGFTTETYDSEGEEKFVAETTNLSLEMIKTIITDFIGEIQQFPPKFSAKKIKGQSAYKLARKGKSFDLKPQKVKIYDITINKFDNPFLNIDVRCSKGTYIRSLAYDLGQKIGYGGYLTALRRKAIGEYKVENALTMDEFIELFSN